MGFKIEGSSSANGVEVNSSNEMKVNLTQTDTNAGYAQLVSVPGSGVAKRVRVSEDNALYTAEMRLLWQLDFNASSTNWATRIGTNATTMSKAGQSTGFHRLNSGASVATSVGISVYSWRTFSIEHGVEYRVSMMARTVNSNATNKQAELGLGYYAFAAGQSNQMNEFVGFRWRTDGTLATVAAFSSGGAPAETEISTGLTMGSSFDAASHYFEIILTDSSVEFWIDDVFINRVTKSAGNYANFKGISLPWIARVYNTASVPSAAFALDLGPQNVFKINPDDGLTYPMVQAGSGKSSYYWQPDMTTGTVHTHNNPANGTAPTAATGSNTASVLNNTANLGGWFRMNGASIVATAHSIVWVAAWQNPPYPTVAGQATNARNFYVTSISVSPLVVSTVLVGGPFQAIWFATIGSSALSSATTDADGTTAVAQTADRLVPLTRVTSFAAAAALGTIETGAGDNTVILTTTPPVHPGQWLKIGLRIISATAVTSGTIDGSINVNGFWD